MQLPIEISRMDLQDLESIKNFLIKNFDDFWNYEIFKNELDNNNSSYLVAKVDRNSSFAVPTNIVRFYWL